MTEQVSSQKSEVVKSNLQVTSQCQKSIIQSFNSNDELNDNCVATLICRSLPDREQQMSIQIHKNVAMAIMQSPSRTLSVTEQTLQS